MAKQIIEVDVPEGWEWRLLGNPFPRYPDGSQVMTYTLCKSWEWPSWIKARYLIPYGETDWFACNTKQINRYAFLACDLIDFNPPPKREMYENPNWPKRPIDGPPLSDTVNQLL